MTIFTIFTIFSIFTIFRYSRSRSEKPGHKLGLWALHDGLQEIPRDYIKVLYYAAEGSGGKKVYEPGGQTSGDARPLK